MRKWITVLMLCVTVMLKNGTEKKYPYVSILKGETAYSVKLYNNDYDNLEMNMADVVWVKETPERGNCG